MTETIYLEHPIYPVKKIVTETDKTYFIHIERDTVFRVYDSETALNELLQNGIDTPLHVCESYEDAIGFIEGNE